MRYVEKHFDAPVVIQHEQELTSVNLDEASLLKRKEKEATILRRILQRA